MDRGYYSVETFLLLLALKVCFIRILLAISGGANLDIPHLITS